MPQVQTAGYCRVRLGRFYVDSPLLLPHGVLLKGAGMDLTALYFSEDTSEWAAQQDDPHALIAPAKLSCAEHCVGLPDAPRFGLSDLAIYVLSYYQSVIDIRNDTVGVSIRRVRIHANAFHCQDWTCGARLRCEWCRPNHPALCHGSSKGWEQSSVLDPRTELIVEDCDLWATWSVFLRARPTSGDPPQGTSGLDRWAVRTDAPQHIYNGGSCHCSITAAN